MRTPCWLSVSVSALVTLFLNGAVQAAVTPNPLFSDGAVLQRRMPIPVWGRADPGERVTVSLNNRTASTLADADGHWMVRLKPLQAGGPYTLTVAGPSNTVTVKNILIGEVWVCSGQSNMEYPMIPEGPTYGGPIGWQAALAGSTDPLLHVWIVPHSPALTPQTTVEGQWAAAGPDSLRYFSAVGYFFGRDLRRSQNVPVGLIESDWGGTVAEAWTDRPTLLADPALKPLADAEQDALASYPQKLQAYRIAQSTVGIPGPNTPKPPADPAKEPMATHLYNGMIAPLQPYAIRGVIWYQGESNVGRGAQYLDLFPSMIADWRKNWGEGTFPFLFVQIAPWQAIAPTPGDSAWAELREAQRLTLSRAPNTAMVVITDLGDIQNIHPRRKELVGDRLALAARVRAYGERVEDTGPVYTAMTVGDGKVRLHFSHAQGMHPAVVIDGDGSQVAPADRAVGFTLAGSDRKFYAADTVTLSGTDVIVSSVHVLNPVAVRYGWADYPVINLQNAAGLWASPFSTDDWPLIKSPTP